MFIQWSQIKATAGALLLASVATVIGAGPLKVQASEIECQVTYGDRRLKFAHCDGAEISFKTVFIAIHGWSGSCKTTFGNGKSSLFAIMTPNRFYDWDCMAYNSESGTLKAAKSKLLTRLRTFKKLGYDRAVLITHSTGGIVALDLLSELVLNDDLSSPDPATIVDRLQQIPSISQVLMWAAPINGLRWNLDRYGTYWFNFVDAKQEILPELGDDSPYLKNLKERLAARYNWWKSQDDAMRGKADTRIAFFHGNREDWVVKSIDEAAARQDWLWPEPYAQVFPVGLPHTENVSNPGSPEAHSITTDLIDQAVLLEVPIAIRASDVFAPFVLIEQQLDVIRGVKFYLQRNFAGGAAEAARFLRFILEERFERHAKVDEALLDELLSVCKSQLPKYPGLGVLFLDAMKNYDFASQPDRRNAGHGLRGFRGRVLAFVREIVSSTKFAATTSASQETQDANRAAQVRAVDIGLSVAKSSFHTEMRDNAFALLMEASGEFDPEVLKSTNFYQRVVGEAFASNASSLPATTRNMVDRILANGVAKSDPQLSQLALQAGSSAILVNGQRLPAWTRFDGTDFVAAVQGIGSTIAEAKGNAYFTELVKTNWQIATQVGVGGNQTSTARQSLKFLGSINVTQQPSMENQIKTQLNTFPVDRLEAYPGLLNQYHSVLSNVGARS